MNMRKENWIDDEIKDQWKKCVSLNVIHKLPSRSRTHFSFRLRNSHWSKSEAKKKKIFFVIFLFFCYEFFLFISFAPKIVFIFRFLLLQVIFKLHLKPLLLWHYYHGMLIMFFDGNLKPSTLALLWLIYSFAWAMEIWIKLPHSLNHRV